LKAVFVATDTGPGAIARCHGFLAVGANGPLGEVETPLFAGDGAEPDYLVVRVSAGGTTRRPLVPVGLVAAVDERSELVVLRTEARELLRLPERLPVAGW
jgi:hypothetical protein